MMKAPLMRRAAARLSVIAVVAAAAALSTVALNPAAAAATQSTQAGTNTVKVKPAGISLQVPNHWLKADLTEESLDQIADGLAAQNPELAEQIRENSAFVEEGSKFYAFDVINGDDANVVVAPGGADGFPSDVETFREDYEAELLGAGDTIVSAKRVKFAGKTAFRVVVRSSVNSPEGAAMPLLVGQVVLRHGGDLVVATVATSDDDSGKQTGDAVLDSVKPLGRKVADRPVSANA
jgi:hypothetical protein